MSIKQQNQNKKCFRCGTKLRKSHVKGYTYFCPTCYEDFYSFEQANPKEEIMLKRYDYINHETEPTEEYQNEQAVIEDATRFYHEHFKEEENYDENFEVKTFEQAKEFWISNGYEIK